MGKLLECAPHDGRARTDRIGMAWRDPAIRQHADRAVAAPDQGHGLLWAEKRRERGVAHVERLKLLPVQHDEVIRLCEQPCGTHEENVASLKDLDESVVERSQDIVHLAR